MRIYSDEYCGFPAHCVEWMDYRAVICPTIGGRLAGLSYHGREVLYMMQELSGYHQDLALRAGESIAQKRESIGFLLYGGMKTWLAPQDLWGMAPYIDLDLAAYEIDIQQHSNKAVIRLASPICRETHIQLQREITIHEQSPKIHIQLMMRNAGMQSVRFGLWEVTQFAGKGEVYVPTGGRELVWKDWNISSLRAADAVQQAGDGWVKIECSQRDAFKTGVEYSEGMQIVRLLDGNEDGLALVRRFPVYPGAEFGHGCAVEVYDSDQYPYFEAETHGPLVELKPGDSFAMQQEWELMEWSKAAPHVEQSL